MKTRPTTPQLSAAAERFLHNILSATAEFAEQQRIAAIQAGKRHSSQQARRK